MKFNARNMRRKLIRQAKKQIRKVNRAEQLEREYHMGVFKTTFVRRGKDYADAPKTREKNRRMRQMIKKEHPAFSCDGVRGA